MPAVLQLGAYNSPLSNYYGLLKKLVSNFSFNSYKEFKMKRSVSAVALAAAGMAIFTTLPAHAGFTIGGIETYRNPDNNVPHQAIYNLGAANTTFTKDSTSVTMKAFANAPADPDGDDVAAQAWDNVTITISLTPNGGSTTMDPCHLNVTDSAKGALTAGPDLGWAFGGAKSEAVFGSYAKAIGTTGGTTNSYEQNSSAGILAALEPITFSGGIPTSFQLVARCSMDVDAEAWVLHDQYEGTGSMDTWAYANMTVNSVY